MILLLDIGNTRLKWGWLRGETVAGGGAVPHRGDGAQAVAALAGCPHPSRVVAACVAGRSIADSVHAWAAATWGLDIEFVRASAEAAGVVNGYAAPAKLGVDRWVAVVGAYRLSGKAVCVVDCGSAITFDAVDASGRHLGGLITPGVRLMRQALSVGTADLPLVDDRPVELFGRDTNTAISSGTALAAAAATEQVAVRMATEIGGDVDLWLTGGDAPVLLPYLTATFRHDPDLVLRGIASFALDARVVSRPGEID